MCTFSNIPIKLSPPEAKNFFIPAGPTLSKPTLFPTNFTDSPKKSVTAPVILETVPDTAEPKEAALVIKFPTPPNKPPLAVNVPAIPVQAPPRAAPKYGIITPIAIVPSGPSLFINLPNFLKALLIPLPIFLNTFFIGLKILLRIPIMYSYNVVPLILLIKLYKLLATSVGS